MRDMCCYFIICGTALQQPVWDEYQIFGQMNIWMYLLPLILDEWIFEYIRHDKNFTNEYPNKFAHEKSTNIFANEYIRPKYSNVFEYQIIFPRLFLTILAIFIFGVILKSYWSILDQYHRYWTNEYPNIFVSINRWRMNIRIYLPWKKFTNIWTNEYICLNIFEYSNIRPTLTATHYG